MTQFSIIPLNYPKSQLKPLAQLHMKIDTSLLRVFFFAQINWNFDKWNHTLTSQGKPFIGTTERKQFALIPMKSKKE